MTLRSRRKKVTTKTGVTLDNVYCRRCMQGKSPKEFWSATDLEIDKNGLMSVCSQCANEMFDMYVISEGSIEVAVLKLCRKLNIRYSEVAIESTKRQMETVRESGKAIPPFFSIYKIKLISTQKGGWGARTENLEYEEVTTINVDTSQNTLETVDSTVIDSEVIEFWGDGLQTEDYRWLEHKLADWKRTHKSDTEAEETLLSEIVMTQFQIRKARKAEKPTSSLVKELQELMKTASVDPAKTALVNSGKSQDTFSSFIKMIEENRPAEYYQDKEVFKDFDNMEYYFEKYVKRPLKNFITGSRDFSLEDSVEDDEDIIDAGIETSVGEAEAED